MTHRRVIAYIDGFNLFYGSLKGTSYKWLDVAALCGSMLRDGDELVAVKYFTAKISSNAADPDKALRQNIYLEALGNNSKTEIILGRFSVHKTKMPLATSDFKNGKITLVEVFKTEEKGTDVNLAIQMVADAKDDKFDYAMLFSNDSDMERAIKIVVGDCKKRVGLFVDRRAMTFGVLTENVLHIKRLSSANFAACQLSDEIVTKTGRVIRKPKDW